MKETMCFLNMVQGKKLMMIIIYYLLTKWCSLISDSVRRYLYLKKNTSGWIQLNECPIHNAQIKSWSHVYYSQKWLRGTSYLGLRLSDLERVEEELHSVKTSNKLLKWSNIAFGEIKQTHNEI